MIYTMTIDKKKIKRIAIIRIGKIGDMIVNDFAFKSIRENFPDAKIMLVTMSRTQDLIKYSTHFDKAIFFKKGLHLIPLIFSIRLFRADLLLDFEDSKSGTSNLIAKIGGAKIKVAFDFGKSNNMLTVPVSYPGNTSGHISTRLRLIPEAIGIKFKESDVRPGIALGKAESALVDMHLKDVCKHMKTIAINISAGHESRYWQQEKWIALIQEIHEYEQGEINFILLSAPEDSVLEDELKYKLSDYYIITPQYRDFHSFAAYIGQSDLLISPDTSAIHIASALSVKVIALFGNTSWNYISWRPIHTISETIISSTPTIAGIEVVEVSNAYKRLCP